MSDDTQETDKVKRRRRQTQYFGWILVAMLIAGLGTFGVQGIGAGVMTVGSVGGKDMTANAYARSLRIEINQLSEQFNTPLTLQLAAPFGVTERALSGVISRTALDAEMQRVGLSVGDAVVADELAADPSFHGLSGSFDAAAYRDILARNNISEPEYESGIRADASRKILTAAIVGGFQAPQPLTDDLYAWVAEKRGYSLLAVTQSALASPVPTPTDADLTEHYNTNIDAYTRAEAKRITYVALLPDAIAPTMSVDETALRALYDSRLAEFVIPEKRLAERLVYPDAAAAEAAVAEIAAGKSFDDLVAARNLTLEDVDMGDVSRTDLGAAAEAVFAMTEPGAVSGVVTTDLGPALFRVNAVIDAQETTFDEVRPSLALELQAETARRNIAERTEALEDLLAGGATLQDIAKEPGMTLATTDYVPGADDNDEIAGYSGFRKAAEALLAGDFAEWTGLDDGGIIAMQLDEVLPPAPIDFDKVKDRVSAAWQEKSLAAALAAQAETSKAAIEAGAKIGSLGIVTVAAAAGRETKPDGAPTGTIQAVFAMKPGEVRIVNDGTNVAIVQLDSITNAVTEGEEAEVVREAIASSLIRSMSRDALDLFTQSLVNGGDLQLDQEAINAIQASFN